MPFEKGSFPGLVAVKEKQLDSTVFSSNRFVAPSRPISEGILIFG